MRCSTARSRWSRRAPPWARSAFSPDTRRFAQAEGYLQVGGNHALLLVEEARPIGDLDAEELRERLSLAERELEQAGEDTERRRVAERDKRRWERFLSLTE